MRPAACARWGAAALAVILTAIQPAGTVRAESAQTDTVQTDEQSLYDVLGLSELIEVMRNEGQAYGAGIGEEFLPGGGSATWAAMVARIYDTEKMRQAVETGLAARIGAGERAALTRFFQSDTGRHIIRQELLARRAFLERETEEAAREAYAAARDKVEDGKDAAQARRLELLESYVAVNDLVELNVAGALTANLRFYRGLVEGGAVEMSEDEILDEVWGQEDDIRADTEDWLMAYLMMAYAPLSDDEIAAYVALSETRAGQALNRGLFTGFDAMYAHLSYALGLAVAQQMRGEDL